MQEEMQRAQADRHHVEQREMQLCQDEADLKAGMSALDDQTAFARQHMERLDETIGTIKIAIDRAMSERQACLRRADKVDS